MYRRLINIGLLVLLAFAAFAQQEDGAALSTDEIKSYKEQSKMMISYLEGTLNFLGDPEEVIAEKEIIINESYLKIFKDAEVQIEDDLDTNRQVPLRKNVQAYLKDIIFFFKEVAFKFEVKSVEQLLNEKGEIVFKVTINRHLHGVTVTKDTIDNNLTRYVEINLDPYRKDLRIVSIYTTKPNEREEMRYWWNHLPAPWRDFFGSKILVFDTLPLNRVVAFDDSLAVIAKDSLMLEKDSLLISGDDTLRFIRLAHLDSGSYRIDYLYDTVLVSCFDTVKTGVSELDGYLRSLFRLEALDIKDNRLIQTLAPLSRLTELKRLNISHVLVDDLTPLRNLNKLEELNLSHTPVKDLRPLRFGFALKILDLSSTRVDSLTVLENLTQLERLLVDSTAVSNLVPLKGLADLTFLSLAHTPVSDLSPIGNLPSLKRLILKGTQVSDLSPLSGLLALEYINVDDTPVSDLSPLASVPTLTTIQANNTKVSKLTSLKNESLKLIYCDNTGVNLNEAVAFMEKHPGCLVIYNSERLFDWWNGLPAAWKEIFVHGYEPDKQVTKEQLHKIVNIKKVVLTGNRAIDDLSPLKMLFRLETLDVSRTPVSSLVPLEGLDNLSYLNIDATKVKGLNSLAQLTGLREVHLEQTEISDLTPLANSTSLQKVYADHSKVTTANVLLLKSKVPECLVIYQTPVLQFWWNNLTEAWRDELVAQIKLDGEPGREALQQIVDLKEIVIKKNDGIKDLEPLTMFHLLKTLTLSFTSVSDLTPLTELDSLQVLRVPNNPVTDITSLSKLKGLVVLDLENTGVDDISPIADLVHLKKLNIAGTKVKKLKVLANLTNLDEFVINNTPVSRLKDIERLPKLKKLVCYNTSIRPKKVEAYKASHPAVEVIFY